MAHQVEVRVLSEQLLEEVGHSASHGASGRNHGHTIPVEATADVEEQVACRAKGDGPF